MTALAGMADALLSCADQARIVLRQNGVCFYCGLNLGLGVIYDHLVPRIRGGTHDHENRVAAHSECDGRKGARMPTDDEIRKQRALIGIGP